MFVLECNAIYDFIYYAVWKAVAVTAEYIYIYCYYRRFNQKTNVNLNESRARADHPITLLTRFLPWRLYGMRRIL